MASAPFLDSCGVEACASVADVRPNCVVWGGTFRINRGEAGGTQREEERHDASIRRPSRASLLRTFDGRVLRMLTDG